MYMKLLTPVIDCGVEGKNLPFTFDTGASGTNLSVRYYNQFRGMSGTWKKGHTKSFGAGGQWFADAQALSAALIGSVDAEVRLLVKGSRMNRLERVVESLTAPDRARAQ